MHILILPLHSEFPFSGKPKTMESQRPKPTSRKQPKISLEDYLDFFESHNQSDLTVNYLKQIIGMHGLKRLKSVPKMAMIEEVNTINPMDPSRSTLKDNISSCAFITLEEAISDLADINWQDCCVTSIQTINAWKENFSAHDLAILNAEQPKSKSKRKLRSRAVVDANACGFDGNSTSTSTCSSAIDGFATKLAPKRKGRRKRITQAGGLVGGAAAAAAARGAVVQSGESSSYLSLGSC